MIKKLDSIFAGDILEIHRKSLFPLWEELGRDFDETSIERFVRKTFCKGGVHGYLINNKIVGVIGFDEINENGLEIVFILVLPEFQKKGIGKNLMEFGERYTKERGYEIISLNVLASNYLAFSFYKKLDYKVIEESFKEGYKKYLMEKKLR